MRAIPQWMWLLSSSTSTVVSHHLSCQPWAIKWFKHFAFIMQNVKELHFSLTSLSWWFFLSTGINLKIIFFTVFWFPCFCVSLCTVCHCEYHSFVMVLMLMQKENQTTKTRRPRKYTVYSDLRHLDDLKGNLVNKLVEIVFSCCSFTYLTAKN